MTEFDAFNEQETALPESLFFGEIVILRGYLGIKIPGERGFPEYDPKNPQHQEAVAAGKKTYACYEVQHFPMGVGFDTWPNQWPIWSDDWKTFEASMGELFGLDPNDKEQRKTLYGVHMRQLSQGGGFFSYETPVIRTYPKRDEHGNETGQTGRILGLKVLQKFADMNECETAYMAHKNNQPVPDGSKVEDKKVDALPLEQALGFVETLARQAMDDNHKAVDREKLAASFATMPMLATLNVDLPEVAKIVEKIEAEPAF